MREEEQRKGFEIALNQEQHALRVRAWGCWDDSFARKFAQVLESTVLYKIGRESRQWDFLDDFRDFTPQSGTVLHIVQDSLDALDIQMHHITHFEKNRQVPAEEKDHDTRCSRFSEWPVTRVFRE